jgi:hypothetical protein
MELNLQEIGENLIKLAMTDGPTQAAIQIAHPRDPRITQDFPIFLETKKIIDKLNLGYLQHLGNLLVFQGADKGNDLSIEEVKQIPVTLGAHLDEITYLVSETKNCENDRLLIPICAPPARTKLVNPSCKVVGFRHQNDGEFVPLGRGSFKVKRKEKTKKVDDLKRVYESIKKDDNGMPQFKKLLDYLLAETVEDVEVNATFEYWLETKADIRMGDMVIQDYNYTSSSVFDAETLIHAKAMDDRVGCIAVLYALSELNKLGIPCKAVLTSSEEGVPKDVSWGRLVRPTYQKYCANDGINIICDGIDGARLDEFSKREGEYMQEAVVLPYTCLGRGGGDPGVFSVMRDIVLPRAKKDGILGLPTTNYVSRSYDTAIMHDFPLIGFVDWVNGEIKGRTAHCHLDESLKLGQVQNIIGVLTYATAYFDRKMRDKPNSIFP